MRIAVDARSLLERPRTGVGEYTDALLTALLRRSDEHRYTLFSNAWGRRFSQSPDWPPDRWTSRAFGMPNRALNASLALFRAPRLERLFGPADVFFAPNANFFSLSARTPFVLTVHDLSFHHFPEFYSWKRRLWHRAVRYAQLLRRADGIIAVSQATADDLVASFPVDPARIHVVHSGIRPAAEPEPMEALVRAYHLPERYLLSLATFEPRKNLVTALAAYEELRREGYMGGLVLAGASGWLMRSFRQRLAKHPYATDIRILGYVREGEKTALYAAADALLYLSRYEGFGFPPLEALTVGTPVIAGHHTSMTETLGGSAVLVDVMNVRDVVTAVETILDDRNSFTPTAAEQQALRERFSWKATADATVAVLESVSATHAHRH